MVHAASPWKTAKDLIDAAKAEPGKITYAHTGPGGCRILSSELFQARAGIKLVPVPYRSGGELGDRGADAERPTPRSAISRR